MSDFYKCHRCGGTKFHHGVTEAYEEDFDSEVPVFVEGERYFDSKPWRCLNCNALLPGAEIKEFLAQVDGAR